LIIFYPEILDNEICLLILKERKLQYFIEFSLKLPKLPEALSLSYSENTIFTFLMTVRTGVGDSVVIIVSVVFVGFAVKKIL